HVHRYITHSSLFSSHCRPPVPHSFPTRRSSDLKIAKFEGAYHGTHDWVMVSVSGDTKATGSRRRPKPIPWSAGIPPAVLKHVVRSEEHTSELQSRGHLVCRLLLEKKKRIPMVNY